MISRKLVSSAVAVVAGFQALPAFAYPFELPNVRIDRPEVIEIRLAESMRLATNTCWDLDSIGFSVRNRNLKLQSLKVRYENGNVDPVAPNRISGVTFVNGNAYGPFRIVKEAGAGGGSGQCVESIIIRADDQDFDLTSTRRAFALVDLFAEGRVIEKVRRADPRPQPQPPIVVRPAPVYETRTRVSLDAGRQELLANPQVSGGMTRDYTVFFASAETAGAIRLKSAYDNALVDEVFVTFANGAAERIELGGLVSDGWVIRDGVIHLSKNESTGMLDLTGYGERNLTSVTVRAREAGGSDEVSRSGIKPVIEVYGIGRKVESYQVCVANCY